MRCLLHIGTEKTGTTLLQDWLYANREALSAQGVCLSDLMDVPNHRKLAAYFQSEPDDYHQTHRIVDAEARAAFFAGFEQALAQEIATLGEGHHTMVITSEHFHSRVDTPEAVAALRDFLDAHFDAVKVVCYFREQSDMLLSLYSTAMRVSHTTTMEEFQREFLVPGAYYCDFEQVADLWAGAFGRDRCDFRLYDRGAFADGDIRRDFIGCLFQPLDTQTLDFALERANEALTAVEAALFRAINQAVPYWLDDDRGVSMRNLWFKYTLAECEPLKVGRLGGANTAAVIRRRFADSNRRFSERYFDGRPLFEDAPETVPADEAPQFSLDQVRTMLVALLEAMMAAQAQASLYDARQQAILQDADADLLRDVALKFETGAAVTVAEAERLLDLANQARPDGQYIRQKLEEYRRLLRE